MNRDEIDLLWYQATRTAIEKGELFTRFEFANLVKQHLIESGYRKCAGGQRITQYCCMVEEAVREEREMCARTVEKIPNTTKTGWRAILPSVCAAAIRAREKT